MADERTTSEEFPAREGEGEGEGAGATATIVRPRTAPPKVDRMPQWKVLLHNDDVNDVFHVVTTIQQLTTLRREEATMRMLEAHETGLALIVTTHQEHAELLQEQFASKLLTVTIEPDN